MARLMQAHSPSLPPSHTKRCNAQAAHMVFKGVSASNDTYSHNKEARLRGATSPRRTREAPWARSLPIPQGCPRWVQLRQGPSVEGGLAGPGYVGKPEIRVAPQGRAAAPPPAAI